MAITFPPERGAALDGKIRRRLAADVRSSKREIVLGLTIGMALAAALGLLGQRYLARREPVSRDASVPDVPVGRGTLGEAVGSAPAGARSVRQEFVREELALRRSHPASESTLPRGESGELSRDVPTTDIGSTPEASPRSHRVDASKRPKSPAGSAQHARSAGTSSVGAATDPFASEPRGAGGEVLKETEPKRKAPLSPAESAGLGLDLTL